MKIRRKEIGVNEPHTIYLITAFLQNKICAAFAPSIN